MQSDRENLRIPGEIGVGGKDGYVQPFGHRADKEVDGSSGNSAGSADVKERRGLNVIGRQDLGLWKCGKTLLEGDKIRLVANSGEYLLLNRTHQHGTTAFDQRGPFFEQAAFFEVEVVAASAEGERPDGGIDQDAHRSFL